MARQPRIDLGGYVYHVINRASGKVPIFKTEEDFLIFEKVLEEAKKREDMRIFAYIVMPNHFHFALYPKNDGDIQKFMGWLTKTHTQRWHVMHDTVGHGHLYQGRYKSLIVNADEHYLAFIKYIEQNSLRAGLIERAENWRWGSLYRRLKGTIEQQKLLHPWILDEPKDYLKEVNTLLNKKELDRVRSSVLKGSPLGGKEWRDKLIEKMNLGYTTRGVGRPKNGS